MWWHQCRRCRWWWRQPRLLVQTSATCWLHGPGSMSHHNLCPVKPPPPFPGPALLVLTWGGGKTYRLLTDQEADATRAGGVPWAQELVPCIGSPARGCLRSWAGGKPRRAGGRRAPSGVHRPARLPSVLTWVQIQESHFGAESAPLTPLCFTDQRDPAGHGLHQAQRLGQEQPVCSPRGPVPRVSSGRGPGLPAAQSTAPPTKCLRR